MATRARRSNAGTPRRILTILLLLIVAVYAGIAGTVAWGSSPKGQWTPLLGLDLEGGRQIVLQPIVGKGQQVNAGQIDGLIVQNPFKMGYLSVKTMVDQLNGQPVEKHIDTGATLVTDKPASGVESIDTKKGKDLCWG